MPAERHIDHLVIGGGIAAASAARTLREEGGQSSTIALVSREADPPYHRPPVSKGYLQGKETREQALVLPARWYEDNGVELLSRVSALNLDVGARTVKLSRGGEVSFGSVILATGAMVRRLGVDGAHLEGIHYLRTLGNADTLREAAAAAHNIVLVGGSYVACEVAASLTALGHRPTMVMLEGVTFERSFGATVGGFFQSRLQEHGVRVIGPDEVERFEGTGDDPDARVTTVVTKGGRRLEADLVVVGVGAMPDVALARRAGLTIGEHGGVLVDSRLRTGEPGVFAAGDIAEYDSVVHGRVLRIEHEDVAEQQGRTAALNALGRDVPHDVVPYFFSDLADWVSLEYVGPASAWDEEVLRGDLADGVFSCWYLHGGRLVAALSVGRSGDLDHARRLLGHAVDAAQLAGGELDAVAAASE